MPPRKTDQFPQRRHSDGDRQARKKAPSVDERTVEHWKRISPLAAMGAHFSKISACCLERPSRRKSTKRASAAPKKPQHRQKLTNLAYADLVATNFDPLHADDRARRKQYRALRTRMKIPEDTPHLMAWVRIGMVLAQETPEFQALRRTRGRPQRATLQPGGPETLKLAKALQRDRGLKPHKALRLAVSQALERPILAGRDSADSHVKRIQRFQKREAQLAHDRLVQILAGVPIA